VNRTINLVLTHAERFGLLVRILDTGDYRFIQHRSPSIEKGFRRHRLRIFRRELRSIAGDSLRAYRKRASRISAAGRWSTYTPLVLETASTFCSIGKLAFAATLFSWRMPVIINVGVNADRLLRYVTSAGLSAAPQNSPA